MNIVSNIYYIAYNTAGLLYYYIAICFNYLRLSYCSNRTTRPTYYDNILCSFRR